MIPEKQVEWELKCYEGIAALERLERWKERGNLALNWGLCGFFAYLLWNDPLPPWFQVVVLVGIFYSVMRRSNTDQKRWKKEEALRSDLIDLDSDHGYETTQAKWDAYYFAVTRNHPKSTITFSRKQR